MAITVSDEAAASAAAEAAVAAAKQFPNDLDVQKGVIAILYSNGNKVGVNTLVEMRVPKLLAAAFDRFKARFSGVDTVR